MLKGLGVWVENPDCVLPIFTNHLDVNQIATDIDRRFCTAPPQISALLIRDHGLTVWAVSLEAANHSIELLEYIFRYMVNARQLGIEGLHNG